LNKIIITVLTLTLAWAGCQPSAKPRSEQTETTVTQSEAVEQPDAEFMAFYEQFHRDSLFQMAHIGWPLQGVTTVQRDSSSTQRQAATWEPAQWRMHRLDVLNNTNDYQREWEMLGSGMVIERIRFKAANFGMERRFARQPNNEWELIYYADVLEL
jgi:Domain of unknown function (DUF4348)